ncbi:MAG: histidine kinase [Acidobacteria bacterium]|nr:histidine kinase [Acidobacteriota bacterium]
MYSLNSASLINLLGFAVGIALYLLLLVMVMQHRRKESKIDLLLLLTGILGIFWNAGELFAIVWRDFAQNPISPLLIAISYSALGFLPSVVVSSAENENKNSRLLTITAFGLSTFAAFLHFQSAVTNGPVPSNLALKLLTIGSVALVAGLLFFNYKQKLENKTVWTAALLIFAVSALHLSSKTEDSSWFIELIAHQSSLPLVLAILIQDYRFAFADLFLKRALSLLLLALTAFSLYVLVAQPLGYLHSSHQENDSLATGVFLVLWIMTALIYPSLHNFSVWLVDRILLKRIDYETLERNISRRIEQIESPDEVLDEVAEKLGEALTAKKCSWSEVYETGAEVTGFPMVELSRERSQIFVPTHESPFFQIHLQNFVGGRRLLSEEVEMLEAVSLLTARKVDALRIVHERCEQEIREQEYTKLTTEAQLTALRSQVNPHFLFNALTTIGYLIQTAPETAFQTLMKLTQLLRSVLRSNGEFCTLGEELKLIENYLDIEKARFEERLTIEIDVSKDLESIRVPSLILQPLVENAVKHGISENKNGGTVRISANIKGTGEEIVLNLEVFDSGSGGSNEENSMSNGIGLENVKGRLRSYYGNKAKLSFEKDSIRGSVARVGIPVGAQAASLQ